MTRIMSALGGHAFTKMNGLGDEIVVVDVRSKPAAIQAAGARAAAGPQRLPYDQMMVLYPPRTPGTDALGAHLSTMMGGSRAPAATAPAAWPSLLFAERRARTALTFETAAGLVVQRWKAEAGLFRVDMGAPKLRWDEIPLAEAFRDTHAIALQIGPIDTPILHSPWW